MRSLTFTKVHSFLILLLLAGCASNDLGDITIDCSQSTLELSLTATTDASGCSISDGTLTVTASGGVAPYTYALGAATNSTGSFNGLAAGNHEVKVVDDNSCEFKLNVSVLALGSNLTATFLMAPDKECLSDNGSIVVTPSGGVTPYEFRINGGAFGSSSSFTGLKPDTYSIEIRDSQGCIIVQNISVDRGPTGVSFANQIMPIINTKCAITGCHNGDNGANRNWTVFSNVKANAGNIKTRTGKQKHAGRWQFDTE